VFLAGRLDDPSPAPTYRRWVVERGGVCAVRSRSSTSIKSLLHEQHTEPENVDVLHEVPTSMGLGLASAALATTTRRTPSSNEASMESAVTCRSTVIERDSHSPARSTTLNRPVNHDCEGPLLARVSPTPTGAFNRCAGVRC